MNTQNKVGARLEKDGKRFADEMVRRMVEGAQVGADGTIKIEFTQDMVNEALIAAGIDPITGEPIAEKRA